MPSYLFKMLPKKNRADKKAVEKIFKQGKFINSPSLTFKFILTQHSAPRISFVVPKKVAKKAVERNLLRRRGYSALEKFFNKLPAGLLGVFIFSKNKVSTQILEEEIKSILNKIK